MLHKCHSLPTAFTGSGLENEGIIDAWQLLGALREKNITLGVHYIKGEVENFSYELHPAVHEYAGFTDEVEELSK